MQQACIPFTVVRQLRCCSTAVETALQREAGQAPGCPMTTGGACNHYEDLGPDLVTPIALQL